MRIAFILIILISLATASYSQKTQFERADSLRGTLSLLRSCFDVSSYRLNLEIDIANKFIAGASTTYFTVVNPTDSIQLDLFNNLQVDSIVSGSSRLRFEREGDAIFIKFPQLLPSGNKDSVTVYYKGKPQAAIKPPWDGGFVWEKDSLGRPWVGVACEGVGASLWWPCKDHPSDEPDSVLMAFTVPKGLTCVSNGNLISQKNLPSGRTTFTWKVNYPINLYNVTLNIANYEHFSDTYIRPDGSKLALDYYVLSYHLKKAKAHFPQVKPMLRCYEKYFGKYPFEKDGYALVETPYWGMEHQGAIAYGNNFKNNVGELDYIILHESAHEWWGNSVSATDHAELWIHESFTTYAEALLVECMYGYPQSVNYLQRQKPFIENEEPILGPKGVNYHYWKDSDMYYKGAWMLHTLRNVIDNDSLWFDIIYGLSAKFKNTVVNSDSIIQYINTQAGQNFQPFFDQYLKHPSPPVLEIKTSRKKRELSIEYRWNTPVKDFAMPVKIQVGEKVQTIYPTTETFQKEVFKGKGKNVEVRTDLYYTEVHFLD